MAWTKIQRSLLEHPKTFGLAELMHWKHDETVGKLVRFWLWCQEYAIDGDLRKHPDTRLAAVVVLNARHASHFVESMCSCGGVAPTGTPAGFLERAPYFRVHDWWDHQKEYLKSRYKDQQTEWKRIEGLYHPPPNTSVTPVQTVGNTDSSKQASELASQASELASHRSKTAASDSPEGSSAARRTADHEATVKAQAAAILAQTRAGPP